MGDGADSIEESAGVRSGVGDCNSISTDGLNAGLCGRGEMSMESLVGPGDEEATGGVVRRKDPAQVEMFVRGSSRNQSYLVH